MAQGKTAQQGVSQKANVRRRQASRRSGKGYLNLIEAVPFGKFAAVDLPRNAGRVAGVYRGAVHAVEDLRDTARFVSRLIDPRDERRSPPGQSARSQAAKAARSAATYSVLGASDPHRVIADIKKVERRLRKDLDPRATPKGKTLNTEMRRNLNIGMNQGEMAFDVGAVARGGPTLKALSKVGAAKPTGPWRIMPKGLTMEEMLDLAGPYKLPGHHYWPKSGIPEKIGRFNVPKILVGRKLPALLSDSPFNLLRYPERSKIENFYEHFKNDPKYKGGKLVGGRPWSGEEWGWTKNGVAGQILQGAPRPLKRALGSAAAAAGIAYGEHETEKRRPTPPRKSAGSR